MSLAYMYVRSTLILGVKGVLKLLVRVLSYYPSEYSSEYEYLFPNHCHRHAQATSFASRVSQANLLPWSSITPFYCAIGFVLPPDTKTSCVFFEHFLHFVYQPF